MAFEALYSKLSVVDIDNQEILNEIEGKKKGASMLNLVCKEIGGEWGIWLDTSEGHILIPPTDLFNSIFGDSDRIWADGFLDEKLEKRIRFYIDVNREPYIYSWSLSSPVVKAFGRRYYMQDAYIDTVKRVLTELNEKMEEGATWAYDSFDAKLESLQMCLKQFEVNAVFPTYYTRMVKDIQKEEFVFKPIDSEEYTIGIGERQYTTFLTHWDNSFDHIRHQFEEYVYGRKATLEMSFDDSDTVLRLQHVSILDHTEKVGEGIGFKYQYYMRVEIESNQFAAMPNIIGYCDIDQTLRTLYEGLLGMALLHPLEGDRYGDEPSRIVAYNRYKSPLIENCLNPDYEPDYTSYRNRQIHVKDVLTMCPDYDELLFDVEGKGWNCDELEELCGRPVEIDGLREWCREIVPAVIESAVGKDFPMDWREYHERGLKLAKELRKVLPQEYDLWYKAPVEDKSGIMPRARLII